MVRVDEELRTIVKYSLGLHELGCLCLFELSQPSEDFCFWIIKADFWDLGGS